LQAWCGLNVHLLGTCRPFAVSCHANRFPLTPCSFLDDRSCRLAPGVEYARGCRGGSRSSLRPLDGAGICKVSTRSVVKNPSICKGETPRSIVYAPQVVAGHARSAKTEGQHVSDGDHRGACAQRPFPATAGCRGGLFVHSRARSPFVL